eukprot:GGOE01003009.1.p2 GENE.GGOE01003009.1~~GGOE01003009.1.p2  ORF type:complete len:125 (+),score=47.81 GGOE01003009.1:34-375(+)
MSAVELVVREPGSARLSTREQADGRLTTLRSTLQRHCAHISELTQRVEEAQAALITLCLGGPRGTAERNASVVELEALLEEWQRQLRKQQVAAEQTALCIAIVEKRSGVTKVP